MPACQAGTGERSYTAFDAFSLMPVPGLGLERFAAAYHLRQSRCFFVSAPLIITRIVVGDLSAALRQERHFESIG